MSIVQALRGGAVLGGLVLLLAASPATTPGTSNEAGQPAQPGQPSQPGQPAQDPGQAAAAAYMQAAEKMNAGMSQMVGDADEDFASMMIAHHQGAIDMAYVELQYGTDPQLKALARKVIEDQTKEIDTLRRWQGRGSTGTR